MKCHLNCECAPTAILHVAKLTNLSCAILLCAYASHTHTHTQTCARFDRDISLAFAAQMLRCCRYTRSHTLRKCVAIVLRINCFAPNVRRCVYPCVCVCVCNEHDDDANVLTHRHTHTHTHTRVCEYLNWTRSVHVCGPETVSRALCGRAAAAR